jgi:hypothetical protein
MVIDGASLSFSPLSFNQKNSREFIHGLWTTNCNYEKVMRLEIPCWRIISSMYGVEMEWHAKQNLRRWHF